MDKIGGHIYHNIHQHTTTHVPILLLQQNDASSSKYFQHSSTIPQRMGFPVHGSYKKVSPPRVESTPGWLDCGKLLLQLASGMRKPFPWIIANACFFERERRSEIPPNEPPIWIGMSWWHGQDLMKNCGATCWVVVHDNLVGMVNMRIKHSLPFKHHWLVHPPVVFLLHRLEWLHRSSKRRKRGMSSESWWVTVNDILV